MCSVYKGASRARVSALRIEGAGDGIRRAAAVGEKVEVKKDNFEEKRRSRQIVDGRRRERSGEGRAFRRERLKRRTSSREESLLEERVARTISAGSIRGR